MTEEHESRMDEAPEIPDVEDASDLVGAESESAADVDAQTVTEDNAEELLLDKTARSLNGDDVPVQLTAEGLLTDDQAASDSTEVADFVEPPRSPLRRKGDWEHDLSAHNVAVELHRIEEEIRTMLEDRDPKRKRKFSGTTRWQELEDDLIGLHYSGRLPEEYVRRIRELVARRHYLFRHLRFLSSTRPTWNS